MEGTVYYEYIPESQQWINITALKFWNDWGSPFIERVQRNGNLVCELCKTTKYPPTYLTLFPFFFWQIMSCLWFRKRPIPLHGSLRILAVPHNLSSTKRKDIRWHWHHQREHNEAPDHYSERLILKMFPITAKTLASTCGFRRRLFWRGLTIYN